MEKIIKLTENDLARIVKRVIIEQIVTPQSLGFSKWSDGGYILRLPKGSTEENDIIRITAEPSGRDKYYVSVMVNGNARMRSEIQNGLTVFRDVQNIFNKKLIRQDAKFESVSGEINGYELEKLVKKLSSLKYDPTKIVFTMNESRIVKRAINEGEKMEKPSHSKKEIKNAARKWVNSKSKDERVKIEMEFGDSDGWVKAVGDAYDEQW